MQQKIPVAKTFLYRLFGVGKIPPALLNELQSEGIVLMEQGVKGSITYRNFRAPGRAAAWRRVWITTALVLTKTRLVALSDAKPFIDVPLADKRIRELKYSVGDNDTLGITFDASLFHTDWSGVLEYRVSTPQAKQYVEQLQSASG